MNGMTQVIAENPKVRVKVKAHAKDMMTTLTRALFMKWLQSLHFEISTDKRKTQSMTS